MATSSITKSFIIDTVEQAELFANAIEESYLESLKPQPPLDFKVTEIETVEELREFMEKREKYFREHGISE